MSERARCLAHDTTQTANETWGTKTTTSEERNEERSTKHNENDPLYVTEAKKRFGDQFVCEPNKAEDYVMCVHLPDTTASQPIPQVAFMVFDNTSNEVVMEQQQGFEGRSII